MAECHKCGGSTWVTGPEGELVECDCRADRVRRARTKRLLTSIPRKFDGVAISPDGRSVTNHGQVLDFPPGVTRDVLKYCRDITAMITQGRGIWFEGDPGTGKTTLAMLVSRTAVAQGHSVAIYSMPRLLSEIRATFDAGSADSQRELMDRLTAVDLLHLDDVGAQQNTDWVLEQLYSIVDDRYSQQRSVIVTTNSTQEELEAQIGPRTVSRLAEMCTVYPLWGHDHRFQASVT